MSCHCVPSARTAGSASHGVPASIRTRWFMTEPSAEMLEERRGGFLLTTSRGRVANAISPGGLSGFCEAIERVSA